MDPQILLYQGFGYITHYPATCPQPAAMVYLFFLFDQYIFQVLKETSYFILCRLCFDASCHIFQQYNAMLHPQWLTFNCLIHMYHTYDNERMYFLCRPKSCMQQADYLLGSYD